MSRGESVPSPLMASFERDGVALVECRSLSAAFAALLEARSPARPGERWGLATGEGRVDLPQDAPSVAVLILSRDRWNRLDRFLDAIERHVPGTPVWVGAESLLIEVRGQGAASPPVPSPGVSGGPGGAPVLGHQQASGLLAQARPLRMPPPALRLTPPDEPRSAESPAPRDVVPAPESQTPEPNVDPSRSPPPAREPEPRRGSEAAVTKDEIEMLLRLFDDMHDGPGDGGRTDLPDRPRPNGGDA